MKARVLVVEDSTPQRESLKALLTTMGYDVSEARNGVEALKAVKTAPPEVVLLDVVLGDMDGFAVCRWLKLDDATARIDPQQAPRLPRPLRPRTDNPLLWRRRLPLRRRSRRFVWNATGHHAPLV